MKDESLQPFNFEIYGKNSEYIYSREDVPIAGLDCVLNRVVASELTEELRNPDTHQFQEDWHGGLPSNAHN